MSDKTGQNSGHKVDFAEYAAALTGDLAVLARRHDMHILAYLLDMARLEAKNATGHAAPDVN